MKGIFALLSGLGAGAALMYFFDPNEGNRRRALVRDKALSMNQRAQDAMQGRVEDLGNRARGMLHEAKAAFSSGSDQTESDRDVNENAGIAGGESYSH
jgi:hypothetical protein